MFVFISYCHTDEENAKKLNELDLLHSELLRPNWTGGGKASIFRTLEFLETSAARNRSSLTAILKKLLCKKSTKTRL